jgi:hypothetical protein
VLAAAILDRLLHHSHRFTSHRVSSTSSRPAASAARREDWPEGYLFVVLFGVEAVKLGQHGPVENADDQNAAVILAPKKDDVRLVGAAQIGAIVGPVQDRKLVQVLAELLQPVDVALGPGLAPALKGILGDGIEIVFGAALIPDSRHGLARRRETVPGAHPVEHAVFGDAAALALFEGGGERLRLGVVALLALAQRFDPGFDHVLDTGEAASRYLRLGKADEVVGQGGRDGLGHGRVSFNDYERVSHLRRLPSTDRRKPKEHRRFFLGLRRPFGRSVAELAARLSHRASVRLTPRTILSARPTTLVQYTGRLHRLHPGKREVRIFDYVDRNVPRLLRMFETRLRGYRAIGYARGEAPLGYTESTEDLTVEYDDVLRALDHEFATDRGDDLDAWVS